MTIPSTAQILQQYGIPVTPAHTSLFEQLEDFEHNRARTTETANMLLNLRLYTAVIYKDCCPKKHFRPEAFTAIFAYVMRYRGYDVKTDAIPRQDLIKINQLTDNYQKFRAASGFPEERNADMRFCAAIDQCYLLAQCLVVMDQGIDINPFCRAIAEQSFTWIKAANKWDTDQGFKVNFGKQVAKAKRRFEQTMGRPPKIKAHSFH